MKGLPMSAGRAAARRRREGGFSLVEVALALMVAAGGMVAIFALFPASMRQSVNARTDMKGALFAADVLEGIAGNVRQIDDIQVWNDPQKWWEVAVNGLDLPGWSSGKTGKQFYDAAMGDGRLGSFSPPTTDLAITYCVDPSTGKYKQPDALYRNAIRYFGREDDTVNTADPVPPQYLVRLEVIRRRALGRTGQELDESFMPNRYLVSVVSSPSASPQIFVNEQIYAQEYFFVHRP